MPYAKVVTTSPLDVVSCVTGRVKLAFGWSVNLRCFFCVFSAAVRFNVTIYWYVVSPTGISALAGNT